MVPFHLRRILRQANARDRRPKARIFNAIQVSRGYPSPKAKRQRRLSPIEREKLVTRVTATFIRRSYTHLSNGGQDPVHTVKSISAIVATCSEFAAVIVIVIGAGRAIWSAITALFRQGALVDPLVVFRTFAGWLVLALEFLLAADILKTAISPSWTDIGQLAAIAAIRTFLNYSLGHDLRRT